MTAVYLNYMITFFDITIFPPKKLQSPGWNFSSSPGVPERKKYIFEYGLSGF